MHAIYILHILYFIILSTAKQTVNTPHAFDLKIIYCQNVFMSNLQFIRIETVPYHSGMQWKCERK